MKSPRNQTVNYLLILLMLLVFIALSVQVKAQEKITAQPNIVLLMAEDIGIDLPSYGTKGLQTPNLDKLAKNGIQFNRFYTNSPICSTSRTSLMTGMYQTSMGGHHHRDKENVLPEHVKPMTHYLRQAGYSVLLGNELVYTAGRKLDLNFKTDKKNPVFDRKKKIEAGKPFFMQIQLKMTHRAMDDTWQQVRKASKHPVALSDVEVPPYLPDHPEVRLDIATYYDTLEYIDHEIGLVQQQLKEKGVLDNTIIIFMGDNGRCQVRGKSYLFEDGIHVPLIVAGPGIAANQINNDMTDGIDLTASILHLAGIQVPDHMQGQPLLNNSNYQAKEEIFAARDRHDEIVDNSRTVVEKRYKYIANFMPQVPWDARMAYYDIPTVRPILPLLRELHAAGKLNADQATFFAKTKPREQLYDLENDPWELNNLADSAAHQKIKARLVKKLDQWIENSNDHGLSKDANGDWQPVLKAFDICSIRSAAERNKKLCAGKTAKKNKKKKKTDKI
ncbi:sulfatase family protein [Colwellia piezophila]|uniref:sulfatase family protein n=1 Tax=Colwellia piezophila TaxID=211668 RepID=UPI001B7F7F11|nr:sulfatase [Colwellia piezophila]